MYKLLRNRWQRGRVRTVSVVLLGALLGVSVWQLNIPSEEQKTANREFIYQRVAEAAAVTAMVNEDTPGWFQEVFGISDEQLLEDSQEFFDEMVDERIPESTLGEWAALFAILGDENRARRALTLVAGKHEEARYQELLVESFLDGETLSAEVEDWVWERLNEETSELPEWHYLQQFEDDGLVGDWLREKGRNIVLRGTFADCALVLIGAAALIGFIWYLLRGRRLPRPATGARLFASWNKRYLLREYCFGELLGIVTAMISGIFFALFFGYEAIILYSSYVFMTVPVVWLIWRLTPGPIAAFRAFGIWRPAWDVRPLLLLGVAGAGWLVVEIVLLGFLEKVPTTLEDAIRIDFLDSPFAVATGFFVAVFLAPLSEEIIFRGFLFGGLSSSWRPIPAGLATSAVFALFHGYSPLGLLATFLYGLIFCWLYWRSGSLLPGMLAHGLFNLVASMQTIGWFSFH